MTDVPDDLSYTKEHLWVRIIDDTVTVGVTEFFADRLGRVTDIELPDAGDAVDFAAEIGSLVGTKGGAFDLFTPLTGTVAEVNEDVVEDPRLVGDDPYDEGWLFTLDDVDDEEVDGLLEPEEYAEYLTGLDE